MRIFIDESGSFTGFHAGSVGAVGALAIPDGKQAFIEKKYAKIRRRLPRLKGEVKGRLLNEKQVAEIVSLIARNAAIFEVTILDLGLHTAEGVAAYKNALLKGMQERIPRFNDETRPKIEALLGSRLIKSTIQGLRPDRQRPSSFEPTCRSALRCA